MPSILVTDRVGREHTLTGESHLTVMETIRDAGIDGLLALCGGVCACATCHVYVDPQFAGLLPPMSDDENALLDGSTKRNERSRLSCQIRLNDGLSGMRLTVADEA